MRRERQQAQPLSPNDNASRKTAGLSAFACHVEAIHTFGIEINAVSDVSHWHGQIARYPSNKIDNGGMFAST